MIRELEYPFDAHYILKKKRSLKKKLLETGGPFLEKKIAVLGGSTTSEIVDMLELFLLNQDIKPTFYASEYGKYWEDVMFDNPELKEFQPDVIFIHTSSRNIQDYPTVRASREEVDAMLDSTYQHFFQLWEKAAEQYHCPIIQNNFELPYYRLMGNRDAWDLHGRVSFTRALNQRFYDYARSHKNFYIHDIDYLAASFGVQKWSDPFFWHMYKYCMTLEAVPEFAFNLSNIIKSLYGRNKKALVLDLDNTLWGGVVGDDGVNGIEIGHETSMGQVYSEFQGYLKAHKDLGVLLNVNSKNDYDNAIAGLNHPEGTLKPEDFIVIKANWDSKDRNLIQIAQELNVMPDSLVFVDDNPAEREMVRTSVPQAAVPPMDRVEQYITTLDRSGFFEVTSLSQDDLKRNEMYRENQQRVQLQNSFADYTEYLRSLEMKAVIRRFDPIYLQRIVQLTNKSNQFNLTTRRYTQAEIEQVMADGRFIPIYGKLTDRFGDNGVVTVVIGEAEGEALHIRLWLMSCRVLKRNMEHAMLDALVEKARQAGVRRLIGYYYKTAKNAMVKDFFGQFGFEKNQETDSGDSVWSLDITQYENKNHVIEVFDNEQR